MRSIHSKYERAILAIKIPSARASEGGRLVQEFEMQCVLGCICVGGLYEDQASHFVMSFNLLVSVDFLC